MERNQNGGSADGDRGTIISAIRLRTLLIFGNSIDPSWDYVFVVIWTALELGVAMIASCLPALRTLFIRLYSSSLSFSVLSSFSTGSRGGKESERIWRRGSRKFVELKEIELDITNVTVNGEVWFYPRKQPMVPPKIIERDKFGKFREEGAAF